jgi:hypothetical protein
MTRTALLDAIEALEAQLDAIIVVGAQAIYLHTGSADVAVAEFTTDGGDLALHPDVLSADPRVNDAMREAELADAQKMIADLKKDVSGIAIEPNPTPAFPLIVETPDIAQPVDPVALATTAPEPFSDGTEIIEPKRRVRKSKTDVVTAQDEESRVGASAVAIVEEPKQPRSSKKNKNQEDAL